MTQFLFIQSVPISFFLLLIRVKKMMRLDDEEAVDTHNKLIDPPLPSPISNQIELIFKRTRIIWQILFLDFVQFSIFKTFFDALSPIKF